MRIKKEGRVNPGQGKIISMGMQATPDGGFQKRGQSFGLGQGSLAGAGNTFTGASPLVGAGGGGNPRGQTITSAPIYYDPRYSTPDKFYFPRTEIQANAIWRHLYETDAAISVATDMYSELPWSDFELVGVHDKRIKEVFESMLDALNLPSHMEGLTKEYLKLGKVIPHLIFDDSKGYFVRLGAFDPDYVKVTPVPFMGEEPLLDLKPDPMMRAFMKSQDARAQVIKAKLPPFLRERILTNSPIPLQNTNTTYVARRTSPYRTIGVSLYTRLFRIQMFEDFLVNASMAVAQRNAAPLRIFRLGDPNTGWLPDDDDISQLAELLAIVESVEGNHYINVLMGDNLEVLTFDELWEKADVPVLPRGNGKEQKDISTKGWKTLSLNKDGTQQWEPLTNILRHPTPEKVVALKTPQAEIRSTESHGFLWLNPQTAELETVTPKQLEERERPTVVNVRDFDFKIDTKKLFGVPLTPDFSYFMGLWTTDGSLNPTSNYVSVSNSDPGILDWVSSFGTYHNVSDYIKTWEGKGNCKTISLQAPSLSQELMNFYEFSSGRGNSVKKTGIEKLPNELLFNSDDQIIGALWSGILDGDGSVGSREITLCYGTSLKLLHQLGLSLLTRGIQSRIAPPGNSEKEYETSFENGSMPVYRLIISGKENMEKFISMCLPYIRHTEKIKKLKAFLEKLQEMPSRYYFTDVYDFDQEILREAFPQGHIDVGQDLNKEGGKGRRDVVGKNPKRRASLDLIQTHGVKDSRAVIQSSRFCSTSVQKISRVEKSSEYVYDLAIDANSHNYLVGGLGWCLNHNTDPFAALLYHTGLQDVQLVGVSDRLMSISKEWDFIERVKFLAMGVSKSFLVGETSFAAALAGLQTLLERLQALRLKFESTWIYPKVLAPIARMNKFYKRSQAELNHRIRLAKTDNDLVIPILKWNKSLEPTQDTTLLTLWDALQQRGVVSRRTLLSGAGLNIDIERANIKEESKYDRAEGIKQQTPEQREQAFADVFAASDKSKKIASTVYHVPSSTVESKIWSKEGKYAGVHFAIVEPIVSLLKHEETDDIEWQDVYDAATSNGGGFTWETIDDELSLRGFTLPEINAIEEILAKEGILPEDTWEKDAEVRMGSIEKELPDEGSSLLTGME